MEMFNRLCILKICNFDQLKPPVLPDIKKMVNTRLHEKYLTEAILFCPISQIFSVVRMPDYLECMEGLSLHFKYTMSVSRVRHYILRYIVWRQYWKFGGTLMYCCHIVPCYQVIL